MDETITIHVISDSKIVQIINFCKPVLGNDIEVSADDLLAFATELQSERKSREYWHLEAEKNGNALAAARLEGERKGIVKGLDMAIAKVTYTHYGDLLTIVLSTLNQLKSDYLEGK
jgi:hypothetical protein